jgi:hypothetical protein
MGKAKKSPPRTIFVFHGAKLWSKGSVIRAKSVEYMLGRGKTEIEAFAYAEGLLVYLNDFDNKSVLERVMLSAQRSGVFSPFVSTSHNRDVARSFALGGHSPGFLLTIEGPEDAFYDFNKIRNICGIPPPSEFEWLEELGIPLKVDVPFRITKVERIQSVVERKTTVYKKRRRS